MKKSLGTMVAIIVAAILMGTFITVKSSIAAEKARDGRFIAYEDGTVLDTKTNLMWAEKDNGSEITWSDARTYCENYRGGGYTDWRLPTAEELAGLYDASIDKKFHLTKLIKLTWGSIWSSEQDGRFYRVYSFTGGAYRLGSNPFYRALPVRSAK